jgi:hypothetical protein
VNKAIAVTAIIALHLVTACASTAPTATSTPQPKATPVEVLATKPEHLEGIWLWWDYRHTMPGSSEGGPYYRWDADGTVWWADRAEMTGNPFTAKFWFEDGRYHEDENHNCIGTGVYEVYLRIEGGRAIRLRMQLIEDGPDCGFRRGRYPRGFVRVD